MRPILPPPCLMLTALGGGPPVFCTVPRQPGMPEERCELRDRPATDSDLSLAPLVALQTEAARGPSADFGFTSRCADIPSQGVQR